MKNETKIKLDAKLERETEKAFLMDCEIDTQNGLDHAKIWFPKSRTELCEGGIEIESWLHSAKANEMNADFICFIEVNNKIKDCAKRKTEKLPVDFSQAQQQVNTLFADGDWIEFRALAKGGGAASIYRQAPIEKDDARLIDWLAIHNTNDWSMYFGANPRSKSTGSGAMGCAKDLDIETYRTNFVDFDDANKAEALKRIGTAGLDAPDLLVSSGRSDGTHAYWFCAEKQTTAEWKSAQCKLIESLGSDKCIKNPSRIMRLCGTMNHKRNAQCQLLATA